MYLFRLMFVSFLLVLNAGTIFSQAVDSVYKVGDMDIYTVQFANVFDGSGTTVISLNSGESLTLRFDDLNPTLRNFSYTIEQYDRDWKPSRLEKQEYLEGYQDDKIISFQNAQATNVAFVHYELAVPNANMRLTKSGNYLLRVFTDDAEKQTVITRRFTVIETVVTVAQMQAIPGALTYNTHHEVHFQIDYKNFRISNPQNEIRATVLQNDRWDNGIYSKPPQYIQGDQIIYDYADTFAFTAGREWRYVDLRSTRFRSDRVSTLTKGDDTWEYKLFPDLDRSRQPYIYYPDLNGKYFINTTDYSSINSTETVCDYLIVNFSLAKPEPIPDANVYLFGALTDWKIHDKFKLVYDEQRQQYRVGTILKQGYYNYFYVTTSGDSKAFSTSTLEGDWYGAQNSYSVFIYYRPFGARYDRIIGYLKLKIQP